LQGAAGSLIVNRGGCSGITLWRHLASHVALGTSLRRQFSRSVSHALLKHIIKKQLINKYEEKKMNEIRKKKKTKLTRRT
jgi:exoribonuclease II